MNNGQDGRAVQGEGLLELVEAEGFPPGAFNRDHLSAVTACHIGQTQTEIALHRDQHLVAGFDRVGQGGLHGSTSGAAHGNGEPVIGLPGVAQQFLHFPHQLNVKGIEVADGGARQGLQHRGMGIGRAWSQQQPVRSGDRSQRAAMGLIQGRQHGKRSQEPIVKQR